METTETETSHAGWQTGMFFDTCVRSPSLGRSSAAASPVRGGVASDENMFKAMAARSDYTTA